MEARDGRAPAGSDAVAAVHQDHGNDWCKHFWLDRTVLFFEHRQHIIVFRLEDEAGHTSKLGGDVPCTCSVLSAAQPRAKHAVRLKQVDVVGANKVLRHDDNRVDKRLLSVVVLRVACCGARQLSNFYFARVTLQAGKQNFALRRLQAVQQGRHAAANRQG